MFKIFKYYLHKIFSSYIEENITDIYDVGLHLPLLLILGTSTASLNYLLISAPSEQLSRDAHMLS
jgi:hypothetical protein